MQEARDSTAKLPSPSPFAGPSPPPYHQHHYGTFSPPPPLPPPVAAAAYRASLTGCGAQGAVAFPCNVQQQQIFVEGLPVREPRLPFCGVGIGWTLFLLGFFMAAIPWYIGAFILFFVALDHREKPGLIACTIAICMTSRTETYKKLLLEHRQLSSDHKKLQADTAAEKEQLQTELQQEREEVSRLRAELAGIQKKHEAEVERVKSSSAEERGRLQGQVRKHEGLFAEAMSQMQSARDELDTFKGDAKNWLSALARINSEMSKNFPYSDPGAITAVNKARTERAKSGALPDEWGVEDHLIALSARVKPLKVIGIDLLDAAIRSFGALWPGEKAPKSVSKLAEALMNSGDRIAEWRESASRVGADMALNFVLSWYEDINLEALRSMRAGSKWSTDPELIKRRQEVAYSLIPYADIHTFVEDPNADEDEDEEEGEDEDSGSSAPAYASSSGAGAN